MEVRDKDRLNKSRRKDCSGLWGFSVRARGLEHQAGISPVQVGEFKHAAASESLCS